MAHMRRGCIAIGVLTCSTCNRSIEHGERYLLIEHEDENADKERICIDCCINNKLAAHVIEKGEKVLTFFTEDLS